MPSTARAVLSKQQKAAPVTDRPMQTNVMAGGLASGSLPPRTDRPPMTASTLLPQPVAPNPPPAPTGLPASPGTFTGQAPTPTPYGDFAGLDPATFAGSPGQKYLQDSSAKAIQRSAAGRGTLLTGNTLDALQQNAIGLSAQDYGNEFNRRLQAYNTNRDTNAQNFGQSMASFGGGLNAFNANTAATLGYGRLAQDAQFGNYDRAYQQAGDQQQYQQSLNNTNAAQNNLAQASAQDAYARQVEEARAAAAAQNAAYTRMRGGVAPRATGDRAIRRSYGGG